MSEDKSFADFKAQFLETFEKNVEKARKKLHVSLEELHDLYITWTDLRNALPKNHKFSPIEVFEMLLVKHHNKSTNSGKKELEIGE